MLTLQLARVPAADHQEPLEVWRDADGVVCAYGCVDDGGFWLGIPGIGSFVVPPSGDVVFGEAEPAVSAALLEDAFRRTVLPLALQARGVEVLHASAVHDARGVIGLCGTSGTGKSTLAANLALVGYDPFADDALAFAVAAGGPIEALAVPFVLAVDDPKVPPRRLPVAPRVLLRVLCILERASGPTAVRELSSSAAFTAVLRHAYSFTLGDAGRTANMVRAYLELVAQVPVLHVSFEPAHDRLQELAAAIVEAVDRLC